MLLCLTTLAAAARAQAPTVPLKPPVVSPPVVQGFTPIYLLHSFQLCCNFMIPGIISPTSPTSGGPNWPAAIDSKLVPAATNGVNFYITPLPASELPGPGAPGRPPAGGTWPKSGVSTPLYVNFFTRQASLDGVTACCTINNGTPIYLDEVVYLDILPIGVIYVPPGDPRATGGAVPKQTFTAVNAVQTSTTKVTSTIDTSTGGVSLGIPGIALTASKSKSTQSQTTDLQQQSMSVMTSAGVAQGPGGYPGQNDIIEVYVNPTFDVQYLGAYSYSTQIPPIPVSPAIPCPAVATATSGICSISEHTAQPSDPGYPLSQWLKCPVQVQDLLTGGPSATCLSSILTAPPQPKLPVNPVSGTIGTTPTLLTPEERVLQIDPMVSAEYTLNPVIPPAPGFTGVPASAGSAPPSVLTDPRFLILGGPGGGGTGWSFCANPGPTPFSAVDTSLNSQQYSTVKKSTSAVTITLNPVQAVEAIAAAGSGTGSGAAAGGDSGSSSPSGSGNSGWAATVTFGESWELDTTVTTSVQNTLTLSSTGNFGSGMTPLLIRAPAPGNPSSGSAASSTIQFLRGTWDGNPSNAWTPNTTYPDTYVANGNFVLPTIDNAYEYQVKTPGVSGATEPTWCITAGCTVKDGTVVWVLFSNTCEALTQFTTGEYYDQWSNTILFWTTPEPTGSALVTGNAQSSQPAN